MDVVRPYTTAIDNWVNAHTSAFVLIVALAAALFLLTCICCVVFAARQCFALLRCLCCCCCCCCGGRQTDEGEAHTCCYDMELGAGERLSTQRSLFTIGDEDDSL